MNALLAISAETERAFDWLCRDVPRDEPVTFVTNPGNIGDALINLSCYRYLSTRYAKLTVRSVDHTPSTDCVFMAGGGNLIEGLYTSVADFVTERCSGRRLFFFPSSVSGFEQWLDGLSGRMRMICREPLSWAHVGDHLPEEEVWLGHDAAFSATGLLRAAFAGGLQNHPRSAARFFRNDDESGHRLRSDGDVMALRGGNWVDLSAAEKAVAEAALTILQFGRVYTDRLHCAILSAILDRYVVLVPNSYFKNKAVFDHSLKTLANVRFETDPTRLVEHAGV